jgi:hypothetical protein
MSEGADAEDRLGHETTVDVSPSQAHVPGNGVPGHGEAPFSFAKATEKPPQVLPVLDRIARAESPGVEQPFLLLCLLKLGNRQLFVRVSGAFWRAWYR